MKTALSVSLMERLVSFYNEPVVSMLDTQYRMTSTIMTWSSNTFYGGKLKAASIAASRTLFQLHGVRDSKITKQEIVLVDTKGTMVQQNSTIQQESAISHQHSLANLGEAGIVLATVRELIRMGVRPQYIGVITYYALQADHVRLVI